MVKFDYWINCLKQWDGTGRPAESTIAIYFDKLSIYGPAELSLKYCIFIYDISGQSETSLNGVLWPLWTCRPPDIATMTLTNLLGAIEKERKMKPISLPPISVCF